MATATLTLGSQNRWLADGATTIWNFNFTGGYLSTDTVFAYSFSTDERVRTAHTLEFLAEFQVRISPAVGVDRTLVIYRDSRNGGLPRADFVDGGGITELNLDMLARQSIFVAQESADFSGIQTEAGVNDLLLAVTTGAGIASAASVAASASAATASSSASAAVVAEVAAQAAQAAAEAAQIAVETIRIPRVDTGAATAGQTVITLSADPLNIDNLQVILDGLTLTKTIDYTWVSGTTLTLTTGMSLGQEYQVRYAQGVVIADAVTRTEIAGTGSGQGASLVGVQDASGNWAAANVETVLTEVATRIGQIQVLVTEPRFSGGADPTGAVDSTAAIQAAIDFVCAPTLANRGEVHFPAGTYKVSTLVLPYGVSLLGQYGRAVRLIATANAPVIHWSASIPSYSRNITIKGFWMVGDGIASGKTSQTAIKIDHPWGHDGLTLQDLYIDGFNGYAIETAQQGSGATTNCFQFSQWSDIQIHNCGDGILMGVGFCGESAFHNVVIQVCTNTCITFSISGTGVGPQGLTFNDLVLGGTPIGLNFT